MASETKPDEDQSGGSTMREDSSREREFRASRELTDLERKRDELRVQLHLGKEELKARWDELETKWLKLRDEVRRTEQASGQTLEELKASVTKLAREVREGYENFKKTL